MARSLLRRAVLAGTALTLVLTGCGGGDDDDDAVASGEGAAVSDYDRDATLRVALNTPPPTLDPHKTASPNALHPYGTLVYDRLTQVGKDLEIQPMLATEWQTAEDGRSVLFTLREGVTFSDGNPVDAEAIKANFDRALTDPQSTVKAALASIASVDVVDPSSVRITATGTAAVLPAVVSGVETSIVSPAAFDNPDLDVKPVGSGPYELEELTLGETATFVRDEDYWDPKAAPAARIEMRYIPDPNARRSALQSGQIDIANTSESEVDALEHLDGVTVHNYPPAVLTNFRLNTGRPNLDKPEVRQALNYAIDRKALNEGLLDGQCDPIGQPLPEIYDGHLTDPPIDYTYDPEKARELLAEAGLADGFSMTMLSGAGTEPFESIGTALQAQFAEVGVDLQIVSQTAPAIFTNWATGAYDSYIIVSATSPSALITMRLTYQVPSRFPGPRPAEFDAALDKANTPGLPEEEYVAALEEASSIAVEEAMNGFVCGRPTQVVATDDVLGADTMGVAYYAGVLDLRYVGLAG